MDKISLDYLLSVAQYMNFSKAAESLYISQSSVSKRIAGLEQELGILFFDRRGRHMEMTEEGRIMIECIRRCKKDFDQSLANALAKSQKGKTNIRLGIINGWELSNALSSAITVFNRTNPDVRIDIASDNMFALIDGIINDKYDVVFSIQDAFPNNTEYQVITYQQVQNVLLYSTENPLAQKEDLNLADFHDSTLYLQGSLTSLYKKGSKFEPFHKKMRYKIIQSWDSLLMALGSSDGYAICNKLFRELASPLFKSLPMPMYDEIILVCKKANQTPLLQDFITCLCNQRQIASLREDAEADSPAI